MLFREGLLQEPEPAFDARRALRHVNAVHMEVGARVE
jgi:hypothetical protein